MSREGAQVISLNRFWCHYRVHVLADSRGQARLDMLYAHIGYDRDAITGPANPLTAQARGSIIDRDIIAV